MTRLKVSEHLTIASQPGLDDFAGFAAEGFKAIVNNRPDGEEPGQPDTAAAKRAAGAAGLRYFAIPVTGATITDADVERFRMAMAAAHGPVLAHCRSGLRTLTLYLLGEVLDGRLAAADLAAFGREHGFDLSGAEAWLHRRAERARPDVRGFFDPRTSTIQYVVADPATGKCAIIDPVHDFDEKSGSTATTSADALLAYVADKGLEVEWILDTHPHADHFSAAAYLKSRTGAPTAIGEHVIDVQQLWRGIYHWPEFPADGSQWDRLFADGEHFTIGSLDARVMFSPGHTLASVTYVIGDAAFVHDTLFMPDSGSARCDFPGGNARRLWSSIRDILALPDATRVFTGHDYQPGGREPRWESTVAEQKQCNTHIVGHDEESFVRLREARDSGLAMPKLILEALQVNIRGGRLPEPEANGMRYLKIPLDALPGAAWGPAW